MSDEASHLPDEHEGDAESALESAARVLRGSATPEGMSQARGREILRGRQERDLLAWARENDCLVESASYRALIEDQGEEHRVWFDSASQRYCKATHAGRFGFAVVALPDGSLELTGGTPLEYLDRLLMHNALFGDSIQLTGIATEFNGTVVLTSQPNIQGCAATSDEMVTFMSKLWFQPLQGLSLGRPGALAFYRDLDEVAAFDAHPGNFVKDEDGIILPIDLVLIQASSELQKAFHPFLGRSDA